MSNWIFAYFLHHAIPDEEDHVFSSHIDQWLYGLKMKEGAAVVNKWTIFGLYNILAK